VHTLRSHSAEFALWDRQEVDVHWSDSKRSVHPEVARIDLFCQNLLEPDQSQSLLVFTATAGSADHENLALLTVLGADRFRVGCPRRHIGVAGGVHTIQRLSAPAKGPCRRKQEPPSPPPAHSREAIGRHDFCLTRRRAGETPPEKPSLPSWPCRFDPGHPLHPAGIRFPTRAIRPGGGSGTASGCSAQASASTPPTSAGPGWTT
jgi:MmyB-like transcription regulator ligand binding domain